MKQFFDLPFPPSTNAYWRNLGNRTIISKRGRIYRKNVISILGKTSFPEEWKANEDVYLGMVIKLYPPDKRKRDIDNYNKAILDSITETGLWLDDCQVKRLTILMKGPVKKGKATILIWRLRNQKDIYDGKTTSLRFNLSEMQGKRITNTKNNQERQYRLL